VFCWREFFPTKEVVQEEQGEEEEEEEEERRRRRRRIFEDIISTVCPLIEFGAENIRAIWCICR
jgi:hypothetical protein